MTHQSFEVWYLAAKPGQRQRFRCVNTQNELARRFFQEEVHRARMLEANGLINLEISESRQEQGKTIVLSFSVEKIAEATDLKSALTSCGDSTKNQPA